MTFERKRYGQNFSIAYTTASKSFSVGGVVLFSLIKCFASIVDDIKLLASLFYHNCPNGMVTSITYNRKTYAPIRHLDDEGGDQGSFVL